jgi:hypothetical protein
VVRADGKVELASWRRLCRYGFHGLARAPEGGMKILHWLVEELKTMLAATVYFATCFTLIMVLKQLLLAQYGIEFRGITTAIVVALVTAKVVIVLQKVPLSRWFEGQPAAVDVVVRTLLYTVATMVALLLEKAFESRAEHGGFVAAVAAVFEHRDVAQVWATTLCVGLAFMAYNTFAVLRREVGTRQLWRIYFGRAAPRQAA